jgi:hypothetical protein
MRTIVVLGVVVVSFAATIATTFIPRPVHSREEMAEHWLGYPVQFLRQDLRRYDPATFPQYFRLEPPWGESSGFAVEVELFLVSWMLILLTIALLAWLLWVAVHRGHRRHAS